MSILQGATDVAITGGTHIATGSGSNVTVVNQLGGQAGASTAFQNLSDASAHAALHDSAVRSFSPRCHRNTRTSYLDALERWMLGRGGEYASARLIWLSGGAGAGKSAIMQSIVERCAQEAVVLGTFFFSRADSTRNHAEVLIPTLAYQLACAFPAAMTVLEPVIQRNPHIFKASLQKQAHELLVRPLLYLTEQGVIDATGPLRKVFVIDGLDECDDPDTQALIIHIFATILCDNVGPVSFLIASRPEVAISRAFQRENRIHPILTSITLDNNDESASDIRQFVEDSFLDIRDTHPLRTHIPSHWPRSYSIDRLVNKSSGHFIYAATAMKFISSTDEHPARALQVIEGLMPSRMGNPFAELDALYLHILTSAKYSSQVLSILRHCIFTCFDNSVIAVCFMYPDMTPEDIVLFLSDVQALVSLAPDDAGEMWITFKHASFNDFLWDADRSSSICMHSTDYRVSMLPRYFQLFDMCYHRTRALFLSSHDISMFGLIDEFAEAIHHSQDIGLLQSLFAEYPVQNFWKFLQGCNLQPNCGLPISGVRHIVRYVHTIRESAANYDNTLYIQQFKMFIDVLMNDLVPKPRYRLIPALLFSSSARSLAVVAPYLICSLPQFGISDSYFDIFWYLQPEKAMYSIRASVIDPRSYKAIRSLPQSRLSWGSDLATALLLVLRQLIGYSWMPECLYPNLHKRWLRRMKPLKHISHGSPNLSCFFCFLIQGLPIPHVAPWVSDDSYRDLRRYGLSGECAGKIGRRREQCFVLLNAVICYLHKCNCTSELAKLARRSLPTAALWFPKLMKRARIKMDAYVRRWEESSDGLLERAKSMSINEMD